MGMGAFLPRPLYQAVTCRCRRLPQTIGFCFNFSWSLAVAFPWLVKDVVAPPQWLAGVPLVKLPVVHLQFSKNIVMWRKSSWKLLHHGQDAGKTGIHAVQDWQSLNKWNQFRGYLHKTALSWNYVSGFFDAEGCIGVDPVSKNLQLKIGQRDPEILHILQMFFFEHLPEQNTVNLYSKPSSHLLTSSQRATSLAILTNLLEHGLQLKRSEALHALNVSTSSHSELRRNVGKGKGKQCYFVRLDEAGCARARSIQKNHKKNFPDGIWAERRDCDRWGSSRISFGQTAAPSAECQNSNSEVAILHSFHPACGGQQLLEISH